MLKKITAIEPQKKNKKRVNVYLDGEFAFGLSRLVAAWLRVGDELPDTKIAELQAREMEEQVLQRALHLLKYRPRSEAEMFDHLRKQDLPEDQIWSVVERLKESHLLDDQQFARTWVENRCEFSPRGRRALAYELRQKKIDAAIIDDVLNDLDEETLAYQAASQRAPRLRGLPREDFHRKLRSFLNRRGFPYETISTVVERLWSEINNQ